MGLFDNLFLDQNTPVTINDGIDHSKDVIVPVAKTATGEPKKDDTVSDLFESDKKEEKAAESALNPEPPTDIALEIGHAPEPVQSDANSIPPADPTAGGMSFDIGGDLSFDIGGDMSAPVGASDDVSLGTVTPSSLGGEVIQIGSVSNIDAGMAITTPEIPTLQATDNAAPSVAPVTTESLPGGVTTGGEAEISTPSVTSESNIFNLIGGADIAAVTPVSPVTPPIATEVSVSEAQNPPVVIEATPTIVPEAAILSPLSGVSIGAPASIGTPESISAPEPILTQTSDPVLEPSYTQSRYASIATLQSDTTLQSDAMLGNDTLALISRDLGQSKLRDKLSSFIDELKTLHTRDQSLKNHKLEQIAMYEERIREIDADAAARKRVLQVEIEDLKRQIQMMDTEKDDIRDVIASFQKELHVS